MARGRWITPDSSASTERVCWRISLPTSVEWLALFKGALDELRFVVNWEQLAGIDADEAATTWAEIYDSISRCNMIGMIFAHANTSVPTNCIECDGIQRLRVDYPELYAVIDSIYHDGPDHFHPPNLHGRFVRGEGRWTPGGTLYSLNDTSGEDQHTLTTGEMPTHGHSEITAVSTLIPAGLEAAVPAATPGVGTTGSAGSGSAHNTLPPYKVMRFAMVAR